MHKRNLKRGFTLVELVIVIVVLAVLIAGLAFYSTQSVARTRLTTAENFLRIMGADMDAAFDDYGPFYIRAGLTDEEIKAEAADYCDELTDGYMHAELDTTTIEMLENGFTVYTVDVDPWGTPYMLYYIDRTPGREPSAGFDETGLEGNFIVICAGPDMVMETPASYYAGNFGDDMVLSGAMKR